MNHFIKLLKLVSSNTDPGAIAASVSCGILLGFIPKENLLWYAVMIFILFLRIQRASYALFLLIGSLIAPSFDTIFDLIGYAVLTWPKAIPLYVKLLNIPFMSLTKFNNTIVLGSFLAGIVLYVPLYFVVRLIIFLWRNYAASFIEKLKIVQWFKNLNIVKKLAYIGESLD